MQVRKQQFELDMEKQPGSKEEKEYIKAVYCRPAYLIFMQSTSWETLGWRKHKLESRLPGEMSITSDMQMTPLLWQKAKKNERINPNPFLVDWNILDLDTGDGYTIIWLY